jgi:outer membrane protein OmpA-like peptidoglycan-associated protein
VCYLHTDNKYEAINYLNKAYQLKPDVASNIHLLRGRAYHLVLDFEKAINQYFEAKKMTSEVEQTKKINRYIEQCKNGIELKKNPVRVIINNLGNKINSEYDEYLSVFTEEESVLYFTSRRPAFDEKKNRRSAIDYKYFEDIYRSQNVDGEFQKAERIDNKKINDKKNKSNNAILDASENGSKLYLYIGDEDEGDIFYTEKNKKNKWKRPKNFSRKVNTDYRETGLFITNDSSTAFYVSNNEKLTKGKSDIFVVKKNEKDKWDNPKNLSPIINTEFDEEGVFFSEKDSTLYFSSRGHNSMGGFDVFRSRLQPDGVWTSPENLGYPINTPDDDLFYRQSDNGKYAYYTANRQTGEGLKDLYKIIFLGSEKELLTETENIPVAGMLKPYPDIIFHDPEKIEIDTSLILQGHITDMKSGDPLVAKVEIINLDKSQVVATALSNKEGFYKVKLPSKINYGIEISAKDYLMYLDVLNLISEPSDELIVKDFKLERVEVGQKIVLENIFFETGKATLKPESYNSLEQVKKLMENNPSLRIEISGHTDNVGSQKSNQKLSENRAKAVADYLIGQGIEKSRIEYKGYGESQPIAPNNTEEGRAKNRRVEFKILSK